MGYVVKIGPRYIRYVDSSTIIAVPTQRRATRFKHRQGVGLFVGEFRNILTGHLGAPRVVKLVPRMTRQ